MTTTITERLKALTPEQVEQLGDSLKQAEDLARKAYKAATTLYGAASNAEFYNHRVAQGYTWTHKPTDIRDRNLKTLREALPTVQELHTQAFQQLDQAAEILSIPVAHIVYLDPIECPYEDATKLEALLERLVNTAHNAKCVLLDARNELGYACSRWCDIVWGRFDQDAPLYKFIDQCVRHLAAAACRLRQLTRLLEQIDDIINEQK